jgi:hypothetical protein
MKPAYFILIALLTTFSFLNQVFAQFNEWEWSVQSVSAEGNYSTDLATDDYNNIYFSGYFYGGPFQIGDSVFYAQEGMHEAFVAAYDKDGMFRWAVPLQKIPEGPFGMVDDCHLAVDSQQNLYVAGEFDFSVDFGDTVLYS